MRQCHVTIYRGKTQELKMQLMQLLTAHSTYLCGMFKDQNDVQIRCRLIRNSKTYNVPVFCITQLLPQLYAWESYTP